MILKQISIENFQSYYEKQTMKFSRGLNLIIGKGGKGKSKLFNAFYWVLFGGIYITDEGWCLTDKLPLSSHGLMRRDEFINKRALFLAEEGDVVTASVVLELEDDNGVEFKIERVASAIRTSAQDWDTDEAWNVRQSILTVSFDTYAGTAVKTGDLAEEVIRNLFPKEIRNYIWFQGESLESLINFKDKRTLEDAVKHISYYPYYEKLSAIISLSSKKIEKLESSALKAANKQNQEISSALSSMDRWKGLIDKKDQEIKTIKESIEQMSLALIEDETKLGAMADFSSLVNEYRVCEKDISNITNDISNHDQTQRRLLPQLWILRGIEPMLEKCKEIIDNYTVEEMQLPHKKFLDNPTKSMLENILKSGQCFVCGNKVEEGNAAYEWITQRIIDQEEYFKELEEYENNLVFNQNFSMFVGKIQDWPNTLPYATGAIDEQFQKSEDEIERLKAARAKLNQHKAELDKKIEEIKSKSGVDPIKEVGTSSHLQSNIRASRSLIEKKEKEIENCNKVKAEYEVDYKKEAAKLAGYSTTEHINTVNETTWKNLTIYLDDICQRVTNNARKKLIRDIEERANVFYTKFTEHDDGYKGNVRISEDYSIEFDAGLNTSHEDRKKMSIINALLALNQEAVGTYYPFISDAPTSSFDSETTFKYLLGIKDIFDQSIIITKDVDEGSANYNELMAQDNIPRIYMLESRNYSDKKDPLREEISTIITTLKNDD